MFSDLTSEKDADGTCGSVQLLSFVCQFFCSVVSTYRVSDYEITVLWYVCSKFTDVSVTASSSEALLSIERI